MSLSVRGKMETLPSKKKVKFSYFPIEVLLPQVEHGNCVLFRGFSNGISNIPINENKKNEELAEADNSVESFQEKVAEVKKIKKNKNFLT